VEPITVVLLETDRLAQLSQRPCGCRVCRDIEVNPPARAMMDEHEHIQLLERHRHRDEEITGDDRDFRVLHVFVIIHYESCRLVHFNVTLHPTAAWALQQLREAIGFDQGYRYRIHDRDRIFARSLDESIEALELRILKSPPQSPMANAICERLIGTIRRECLDWLIPISAAHLRSILKIWMGHYNNSRPHMALGPGVPDPPPKAAPFQAQQTRHRIVEGLVVLGKSVLGGLHHEYSLAPAVA
jgi:transposase InsO family protein